METQILVSVCLCTYKRPGGLSGILNALMRQKDLLGPFEIIIVDNDAAGSAREIIEEFQNRSDNIPIQYYIEPQQNIALARNRSVKEANGEWLAFIDDDEIPKLEWLSELVATALHYKADGVFGPVTAALPEETPHWIYKGKFFEKKSGQHNGDVVTASATRTSNTLIRSSSMKNRKTLFDPKLGLTGGSDSHLFADMLACGAYFVWCNDAAVTELIPKSRANFSWLMKRWYRNGQIHAERMINEKGKQAYFGLIIWGIGGLGAASLIAPLMLPFGIHRSVNWLRKGALGLSYLMSLTNYRYEPYRNRSQNS